MENAKTGHKAKIIDHSLRIWAGQLLTGLFLPIFDQLYTPENPKFVTIQPPFRGWTGSRQLVNNSSMKERSGAGEKSAGRKRHRAAWTPLESKKRGPKIHLIVAKGGQKKNGDKWAKTEGKKLAKKMAKSGLKWPTKVGRSESS